MRAFLWVAIITAFTAIPTVKMVNATEASQPSTMASGWTATECKTLLESPPGAKDAAVRLLVAPSGSVLSGSVASSTGQPDLDKAVLEASSHCQFSLSGMQKSEPQWVNLPWPLFRTKPQTAQKPVPVGAEQLEEGLDAAKRWDWPSALRLLLPFAEKGNAQAQAKVGEAYFLGDVNVNGVWLGNHGVHRAFVEAAKWFQKAADQGDLGAENYLAGMYRMGQGVPIDKAEALKRFLNLTHQRSVGAFINLGNMYQVGDGVPVDYVQAYMWNRLAANEAAARHFDNVRETAESRMKYLVPLMTSDQRAEAERRARDWKSAP